MPTTRSHLSRIQTVKYTIHFDRRFNRTNNMIKFIFMLILLIQVMIISAIIYGAYLFSASDFSLNEIGYAIGSFIGSIKKGMN
jgi:hypothetical protein